MTTKPATTKLVTITATWNGVSKSTVVTVTPAAALSALTLPVSATAFADAVGTVVLNGPAPAGGASVSLSTTSSAIDTLPSTVMVPANFRSFTFPFKTTYVDATTDAVITATYNGVSVNGTMTVTPGPVPLTLKLDLPTVVGGRTVGGTVTMNSPVAAGTSLTLSSSNPAVASVPATAIEWYGIHFTVTTYPVDLPVTANISVTYNGSTRTVPLRVTHNPELAKLTFSAASIIKTASTTGTVTIGGPAQSGGEIVTLATSNSSVATVPATVTVPAGATTATFTASGVSSLAVAGTATITAMLGGQTGSADVEVTPAAALRGLTSYASSGTGGVGPETFTLSFNGPAPATHVTMTSSNTAAATVPATVNIPLGTITKDFDVTPLVVAEDTTVGITGSYQGDFVQSVYTVLQPHLLSVSFVGSNQLWPGGTFVARATLTGPAPPVGYPLTVSWSSPSATLTMPTSITVPAGALYVDFTGNMVGQPSGPECWYHAWIYVHDGCEYMTLWLNIVNFYFTSVTIPRQSSAATRRR